jgi:hypothetical protein
MTRAQILAAYRAYVPDETEPTELEALALSLMPWPVYKTGEYDRYDDATPYPHIVIGMSETAPDEITVFREMFDTDGEWWIPARSLNAAQELLMELNRRDLMQRFQLELWLLINPSGPAEPREDFGMTYNWSWDHWYVDEFLMATPAQWTTAALLAACEPKVEVTT